MLNRVQTIGAGTAQVSDGRSIHMLGKTASRQDFKDRKLAVDIVNQTQKIKRSHQPTVE